MAKRQLTYGMCFGDGSYDRGQVTVSIQRKRLSGRLTKGARSLLLTTSDEQIWIVDALEVDPSFVGKDVIIDGVLTSADRIQAEWIGCA